MVACAGLDLVLAHAARCRGRLNPYAPARGARKVMTDTFLEDRKACMMAGMSDHVGKLVALAVVYAGATEMAAAAGN